MKHRTAGHTETSISGDTREDWSDAFELVPSLQIAYVWHASRFQLNSVCRISDERKRLPLAKQARYGLRFRGIATRHPVVSAKPNVADPVDRILRNRGNGISPLLVGNGEQGVDLLRSESR
jgi:hypothetical protein